jgi:hypothetical protein
MFGQAKGSVYGGVLYLPQHPDADIHGLVRGVMRTSKVHFVAQALDALGVLVPMKLFQWHLWGESASAVERMVTEPHYGAMMVSPLVSAYITAERYKVLPKEYFQRVRGA